MSGTAHPPVHRDEARRVIYGVAAIALLVVVGIVGAIVQTGGPLPGKRYTYVHADFSDVGVLKTGKDVKQGGVRIGTISEVRYEDGRAAVTLRLDGHPKVYADASARVGNASALGKKFVELDPGTPDAGLLGDRTVTRTESSTSVEDVLDTFDPATRKALQGALGELGPGLAGHGEDLNSVLAVAPRLLDDVDTLTGALTSPSSDLPALLSSADRLAGRFRGREDEIRALLRNADDTLAAVATRKGKPLAEAVGELPGTLRQAKAALDALEQPLTDARVALTTLRPGTSALGKATPSLRGVLRDGVGPLRKVPAVAGLASPAVDDLAGTLADARPLVPQLTGAITSLDELLFKFAPYAGDAGKFFSQNSLLSGTIGGNPNVHYFAAQLTGVGLFSVNGLPDPFYRQDAYPAPGTANVPNTSSERNP